MPKSNEVILNANHLKKDIIFSSDEMSSDLLDALGNKILHLALLNPMVVDLINNASLKGPIRIVFLPETPGLSPAWWDRNNDSIFIRCNLEKPFKVKTFMKTFYAFIFEMANAANPYFQIGTEESKLVNISAHQNEESYARMMELAEYTTSTMACDVYSYAKQNKLWKTKEVGRMKPMNGFQKNWHDLNKKYKRMQLSHADQYREDFIRTKEKIRELEAEIESNQQYLQLNQSNYATTQRSIISHNESTIAASSSSTTQDPIAPKVAYYEEIQELVAALERGQQNIDECKVILARIKHKIQQLKVELECNKQNLEWLNEELEYDFNSLQSSFGFFASSNHINGTTTKKSITSQDKPNFAASSNCG